MGVNPLEVTLTDFIKPCIDLLITLKCMMMFVIKVFVSR